MLAARKVFIDAGYEAASMDVIARAANVSKATVYAYYPSKEQLFIAMVADCAGEQQAAFSATEANHRSVANGLLDIANAVMRWWCEPGVLVFGRMIMGEAARFPNLGRTFIIEGRLGIQKRIADFFRNAADSGQLRVEDPDLVAELFVGAMQAAINQCDLMALGKGPTPEDVQRIVHMSVKIFLRAHGVEPALAVRARKRKPAPIARKAIRKKPSRSSR